MDDQLAAAASHISVGTGLSILGMAFAAWAWVVAWGVSVIRKEIAEMKEEAKETAMEFHKITLNREGRLAKLETVAELCIAGREEAIRKRGEDRELLRGFAKRGEEE